MRGAGGAQPNISQEKIIHTSAVRFRLLKSKNVSSQGLTN